jgi:hypothetical protein
MGLRDIRQGPRRRIVLLYKNLDRFTREVLLECDHFGKAKYDKTYDDLVRCPRCRDGWPPDRPGTTAETRLLME